MFGRQVLTSLSFPMLIYRSRNLSSPARSQPSHQTLHRARTALPTNAATAEKSIASSSKRRVPLSHDPTILHIYLSFGVDEKISQFSDDGVPARVVSLAMQLTPRQSFRSFSTTTLSLEPGGEERATANDAICAESPADGDATHDRHTTRPDCVATSLEVVDEGPSFAADWF